MMKDIGQIVKHFRLPSWDITKEGVGGIKAAVLGTYIVSWTFYSYSTLLSNKDESLDFRVSCWHHDVIIALRARNKNK